MTAAASNASAFFEQIARERRVFSFMQGGELLVFPATDGEVTPFWSSRARVERVQDAHPKYRAFVVDEISLNAFLRKVLPQLNDERVRLGANWSGPGLTGYDYSVRDVRKNLRYWLERING